MFLLTYILYICYDKIGQIFLRIGRYQLFKKNCAGQCQSLKQSNSVKGTFDTNFI